jgi:hypothetical protein
MAAQGWDRVKEAVRWLSARKKPSRKARIRARRVLIPQAQAITMFR